MIASEKSTYEIAILGPADRLERWDAFVDESPQGSVFCRSWWLQAVCPDEFRILTMEKGDRVVAGMPFRVTQQKRKGAVIGMPPLTQTLGVLLAAPTSDKYETNLSNEMKVLEAFVQAIPEFRHFAMNFHYTFTNWLPFFWAGYEQTTRYTYVMEDLSDLEAVSRDMSVNARNTIRKAEKLGVRVEESEDVDLFLDLNSRTFERQGRETPHADGLVRGIDGACAERNARRILLAKDADGRVHAATYVVFDRKCMYYLMHGADPSLRTSGANALTIWHALKLAQTVTKKFDFEGSMMANVEPLLRRFGARQMPYFSISRDNRGAIRRCYSAVRREWRKGSSPG